MKIVYQNPNDTMFMFRKAVLSYGMWDTVRVDRGKEFYLMLHFQEKFRHYRHNISRKPFIQSKSTDVCN